MSVRIVQNVKLMLHNISNDLPQNFVTQLNDTK